MDGRNPIVNPPASLAPCEAAVITPPSPPVTTTPPAAAIRRPTSRAAAMVAALTGSLAVCSFFPITPIVVSRLLLPVMDHLCLIQGSQLSDPFTFQGSQPVHGFFS